MTYIHRARWLRDAPPQSTDALMAQRGGVAPHPGTQPCAWEPGTGFGFLALTFDTRLTSFLLSLALLL